MEKIVVAEASSTIKSVADTLLRQNGYDVICTSDGLQAWEVIQSERPALVLAGLNLSGISGLELCRQVTGGRPDSGTPVVLMMSSKDVLTDEQLKSSGARGRLKKPFSPRDLLEAVNRVIGQGQAAPAEKTGRTKGTAKTSYKAEVMPGSTEIPTGESGVYNLDWKDLENMDGSEDEPETGSDGDSDSQRLVLEEDQYNLIPGPGEELADEEGSQAPDEDDEDYEWFIGEMKREIEGGGPSRDKQAPRKKSEKPRNIPSEKAPSKEMKFEDLSPAPPARESRKAAELAVAEEAKKDRPADTLSQDEIERIAEKVVGKLAAKIAAQLDRKTIYEAIRTVLKS
jgi:twitching motility two-component system response regulator PilH